MTMGDRIKTRQQLLDEQTDATNSRTAPGDDRPNGGCCIKANGVLAMPENREAVPVSTLENRSKLDIRGPVACLLGEHMD